MAGDVARKAELTKESIRDYGDQWSRFQKIDGYYSSQAMLRDLLDPFIDAAALHGKSVAEIGSGQGRIVKMLLDAGAEKVCAVEPSDAMQTLKRNTEAYSERIEYVHGPGEEIPARDFDYVFSIGVLHHIPDPVPVVRAAHTSLKPGGEMLIWLYGAEGTGLYRALFLPLRAITTRLPHWLLAILCRIIWFAAETYSWLCRFLPLPLKRYTREVYSKFDPHTRYVVIYDQLNPAYAKYYNEKEARALLEEAGFKDVKLHHRHGYSWTVIGTKESN